MIRSGQELALQFRQFQWAFVQKKEEAACAESLYLLAWPCTPLVVGNHSLATLGRDLIFFFFCPCPQLSQGFSLSSRKLLGEAKDSK